VPKKLNCKILRVALSTVSTLWFSQRGLAYSANRVSFEFRPNGIYRVYINYTVPELKEYRDAYVEFRKKKEAEKFYFDLLRGAEFYPPIPEQLRFQPPPNGPRPW
jgi:hypothetical protein